MSIYKTDSYSLSHFGGIVKDKWYLASYFSKLTYSYVRRHNNIIAHWLVRQAIFFFFFTGLIEDVPLDIIDIFQTDFNSLC